MRNVKDKTAEHSLAPEKVEQHTHEAVREFPGDSFKGTLRAMADATADTYQVDAPICFATALAAVSAAMGKSYLASNGSNHPPTCGNLYVLVSSCTSGGKGITTTCILKPFYEWDKARHEKFVEGIPAKKASLDTLNMKKRNLLNNSKKKSSTADFGQELIRIQTEIDSLSDDGKTLKDLPPLFVENVTSEALAIALEESGGALFSTSSEAGGLIAIAKGRYGDKGNDFTVLLKGYSGDPLDFRRVNRAKVKVPNPRLALLWMAQPSVVNELLHDRAASLQGMTGRPLYFPGRSLLEPEELEPREIAEEIHGSWKELLETILRFREESESPLDVPCSQEARKLFLDFHNETTDSMRNGMMSYANELGKARENAIRVALVLAVAEHPKAQPKEVTSDQAQRAIDLVKWCQFQLIEEIGTHRANNLADRSRVLRNLLLEKYADETGCTVRDMGRLHGFDKEEIQEIVGCFQDLYELHEKKPHTGRSSLVVRLRAA